MDYFLYKNGELFAENVNVAKIAEAVGTPVYIYSKATLLEHYNRVKQAYSELDTLVCYSIKACANIHILKMLAEAGSGFFVLNRPGPTPPKLSMRA
jgi:diaminopimelate decarboxylase